jgi:hypothetical protein
MKPALDLDKLSRVASNLGLRVVSQVAPPTFEDLEESFSLHVNGSFVKFFRVTGDVIAWTSAIHNGYTIVLIPGVKLIDIHEAKEQHEDTPLLRGITYVRTQDGQTHGLREFLAAGPYKKPNDVEAYLAKAETSFDISLDEFERKR